MKTAQLGKGIFGKYETRGCNFGYVVTSEGVVLIDVPGDPVYVEEYRQELARLGKIRYIINTEYHFDHNMTAGFFGAPVIASEVTRSLWRQNTPEVLSESTKALYAEPFTVPDPAIYLKGYPTITFSDRMTLFMGSHTLELLFVPGHTAGQTAVYIPEEKVLFAADNVMSSGEIGPLHDAAPYDYIKSLERLKELDTRCVQTGHGYFLTEDVKPTMERLLASLKERVRTVEKFMADQLTIEQAADEWDRLFPFRPFPAAEGYREYSNLFTRIQVRHMYEALERK